LIAGQFLPLGRAFSQPKDSLGTQVPETSESEKELPMTSHRILRAGIFILAFLVGLLRESIARGHSSLTPAYKPAPSLASTEIHQC
jgi:hypothetical protein